MIELFLLLVLGSTGCGLVLFRLGFSGSVSAILGSAAGPVLFALLPLEFSGVVPTRVSVVLLTLGCVAFAFLPRLPSEQSGDATGAEPGPRGEQIPIAIMAVLGSFILMVLPWLAPLMAHDATEYALLASRLADLGGDLSYPVVPADPSSGFFFPSSHPRGYAALLAAGIHPSDGIADLSMRVVTTWYVVLFLIGLTRLVPSGVGRALVLVLGTSVPLLAVQVSDLSIDPIRLSLTTAAMLAAGELLARVSWRSAVGCGIVFGGLANVHSSSIAVLGLLSLAIFILIDGRIVQRLGITSLVVVVMLMLGGWQYLDNLLERGSPVSDSVLVWEVESLGEVEDLRIRRDLDTLGGRFVRSFGPFLLFLMFGPLWLVAIPGAYRALRLRGSPWEKLSLVLLCGFLGAMFVTGLAGIDLLIKNPRYALSTLPAAAVLGANALVAASVAWRTMIAGIVFSTLMISVLLALNSKVSIRSVIDQASDEWLATGTVADQDLGILAEVLPQEGSRTMVTSQGPWARWVGTPMISHIDEALLPVYLAETPEAAMREMRRLDIDRVFYVSYFPACWSNSRVIDLMMSPEFTRKLDVGANASSLVCELLDVPRSVVYRPVAPDSVSLARADRGLFSSLLRENIASLGHRPPDARRLGYRLRLRCSDRGFYRVFVRDPSGEKLVWDGVSLEPGSEREVFVRTPYPVESIVVILEMLQDITVELLSAEEAVELPLGDGVDSQDTVD